MTIHLAGEFQKWFVFWLLYLTAFILFFLFVLVGRDIHKLSPIFFIGICFIIVCGSGLFAGMVKIFTDCEVTESKITGSLKQKTVNWQDLKSVYSIPVIPVVMVQGKGSITPILVPKVTMLKNRESVLNELKVLLKENPAIVENDGARAFFIKYNVLER